jgi:hypothetical protein
MNIENEIWFKAQPKSTKSKTKIFVYVKKGISTTKYPKIKNIKIVKENKIKKNK